MTLAQRLLFATALLAFAATLSFGYGVREAWRRAEERRFNAEFEAAMEPLREALESQLRDLPLLLDSTCAHDSLVDGALVGLVGGDLQNRRLSLSLRVPELAKAAALDELFLITHRGEILGAAKDGLVGKRDPELAARVEKRAAPALLRSSPPPRAIEAACRRLDSGSRAWVGLIGARHIDPLLSRIGKSHGVELSLSEERAADNQLEARFVLEDLGLRVTARRSRVPIDDALRELDSQVLWIGGVTVAAALVLAALLARGLSRPLVELARQASEVMKGEPRPIEAHGPREVLESAAAFNRAIADLASLRRSLAASERIAAWRETARHVAHEIKTPLAPIRAAIETLRRLRARNDPAFDEYFDEATRTALDEVGRINHIVSEFTRFARLPPPNPSEVDPVEVVRSVVTLHSSIGTEIAFEAGACPTVRADRDQIVQVVTNLIQNALDAVQGRPEPRVVVSVRPDDSSAVVISVRDNGPGVAEDLRARLFQPYATTKAHGTGLGLAIAQRLVNEHGGEIEYTAPAGGGAEFRVVLPVGGPPHSTRQISGQD